jgi:hypothetical protein
MSAPFAGGFNKSFLDVSKHALRSVTLSSALHFSKLGLLTSQMAAMKQDMHITSSAVLLKSSCGTKVVVGAYKCEVDRAMIL